MVFGFPTVQGLERFPGENVLHIDIVESALLRRFTFALHAAHAALTGFDQHPDMRRLWLALLCTAVVFVPTSAAAAKTVDRGIVVRVRPPQLAIRELDGSRMRFAINRATSITLNGRRVRLARLRRGDVATIDHAGRFVIAISAVRP
jgi:hypothetical protein